MVSFILNKINEGGGIKPSVKLDALPAPILRDLVRECIEAHLDETTFTITRIIEQSKRDTLADFSGNFVLEQNSDARDS